MPNKKGAKIKSPTIPVTLKGRSTFPIKVLALIDSGADVSIIPISLAELLNLNLPEEIQIAHGIGGEVKAKSSKMEIIVEKNREKYSFMIPVQVILDNNTPIILGRKGFFDKFIIAIDEKKKKVKLKRKTELF